MQRRNYTAILILLYSVGISNVTFAGTGDASDLRHQNNKSATNATTTELLKAYLKMLQFKHKVHSTNIANLNTPNFKADDVEMPRKYSDLIKNGRSKKGVTISRTSPKHLSGSHHDSYFKSHKLKDPYEVKPNGNNVSLQQQMTKLAQNNSSYNAAMKIYASNNSLIAAAISKQQ